MNPNTYSVFTKTYVTVLFIFAFGISNVPLKADNPSETAPIQHEMEGPKTGYKAEWKFNQVDKHQAPQNGLALSGGGMRSGIFSIGVLQGLFEDKKLKELDVISSVSGGGYAASWFFVQSIQSQRNWKLMFDPNGKYQIYLVDHGELVSHAAANLDPLRQAEYAVNGVEILGSIPVNAFFNFLFGMKLNISPMRHIYQAGIDRVFQVEPNKDGKRSACDLRHFEDFSLLSNPPKSPSFSDMATALETYHLPFFILNTTAHIEDASVEDEALLNSRVFEFTPLHFGSDYFGYTNNFPIKYNRAVSVSGAALDSKKLRDSNTRFFASIANYDLGYTINNPKSSNVGRRLRNLIPIPFYVFDGHYQRDKKGDRISLADGGHCENLAAYSLIRRGCQNITIVDGGYDPDYDFEDYYLLQKNIKREMGADLSIAELDNHSFCSSSPKMVGKVTFPIDPDTLKPIRPTINITYIKLSIDKSKVYGGANLYPPEVIDYYKANPHEFPQLTTANQTFNPAQVKAYRELGRYIVKNY